MRIHLPPEASWNTPRCLIAEQLATAEALGVAPDPIQRGVGAADQKPRLLHRQAGGMGDHQIRRLVAIGPRAA